MGIVYLAVDSDGRRAALKVIRLDLADDQGFRQRFAREVAAASRVRSPVTAAVLAADPTGERPWVAFEYVDAPNLAEVLAGGVPRLSAGLGILSGVAEALVAIHSAGLVHRDLKPANVLVAPSGVVVIDFGIAAALDATTLTHSGVIGTPGWLAPEQIRGERVTFATDSFAWATLATYTTTGRHPFGNPDQAVAAYLYRIVHEPPDLDGLPPQLYGIVSAALARDPVSRPDANALLAALLPVGAPNAQTAPLNTAAPTTALIPSSTPTDVSTSPAPITPTRKGRRWIAAAAAGLLAVALITVVFALLSHSRTPSSPSSATTSPVAPATSSSPSATTTLPTTAPTTTPPTAVPTPATRPVSVSTCPTEFGVEGQTAPAGPSSMNAPTSVAPNLGGYSNGLIGMLAPAGWACSAVVGADGGRSLDIYPSTQTPSALQIQTGMPSDALAVRVEIPSQGTGPASYLACPYFATAAAGSGVPCQTPPPGEIIHRGGANFVEIQDPPGVTGLLSPSGGTYPANGVVIWDPTTQYSAQAICTLPQEQHQICTAVLNDFLVRYRTPPTTSTSAEAPSTTAPTSAPLPLLSIPSTHGSSGYLGRFPTAIAFSADGGNIVGRLSWSAWGPDGAVGNGTWDYLNCVPNCAAGTDTPYPATVTLSEPVNGVYTKVQEATSGPDGSTLVYTYGTQVWPQGAQ